MVLDMYEWAKDDDELADLVGWLAARTERGCWEWTRSTLKGGYGQFMHAGRNWQAHRLMWTLKYGPIPDAMIVCHHCDNPPCINPAHLFLGTPLDNNRDMVSKGRRVVAGVCAVNAEKTHCVHGHEFTPDNSCERPSRPGTRECRICLGEASARAKASRRAA